MGKERDLIKAIKEKDFSKVQRVLSTTEKRKDRESLNWKSVDSGDKIRVELRHIDVNTHEPDTGYTPLHLAVLNGLKQVVERLIFNCAKVNEQDSKGNSPLHLAVFLGRADLVDVLIANEVEVNDHNKDGNTALHIACEGVVDQRAVIIKALIKAGANVWATNKYNLTPLDTAATFKIDDAIITLMTYVPTLVDNKSAIVEASIRGFKSTVELLLDFGVDCNRLDENHGSAALHEAVRFRRTEVVSVLMAFGANPDLANLKKETPRTIAESLPSGDQYTELLKAKATKSPQERSSVKRMDSTDVSSQELTLGHIKDYPELPNDISWTQNRPLYCSSCTEKNPNTQILDDNMKSFWVIPVLHDAWTVLDFKNEYVLTGITVYGWNSPQMMKTFQLQTASAIEGPWTTLTSHTCQLLGSTDPKEPAFPQVFKGFTFTSRYLRLYVVDNHGGSYICFQGIQFHGADGKVVEELKNCGLTKAVDTFIQKKFNTWKRFLDISQDEIYEIVKDPVKKASLLESIYRGRREMYPMTSLMWLTPPETSAFVGDVLPDFSVQSDPGVTEVLQLVVQGAEVSGDTCRRLIANGDGKPSTATFSNISLKPAGLYTILVQGMNTHITLMAPKPLEIRPEVKTEGAISNAFDEIQQMLNQMQASLSTD